MKEESMHMTLATYVGAGLFVLDWCGLGGMIVVFDVLRGVLPR